MTSIVIPRIEIGQLFQSKDKRDRGRTLRIKGVKRVAGVPDATGYWICEPVSADGTRVTSMRETVLHERTLREKFRFVQPK